MESQTQRISRYGYGYDHVGNRLSMETLEELLRYSYNPIYELEGVTEAPVMDPDAAVPAHSYDYDNVGSRVTADGVMYTANHLLEDEGKLKVAPRPKNRASGRFALPWLLFYV